MEEIKDAYLLLVYRHHRSSRWEVHSIECLAIISYLVCWLMAIQKEDKRLLLPQMGLSELEFLNSLY